MTKLTPAPGFAIIEPIEETTTISIVKDDKPVQKGKIIEIGEMLFSSQGGDDVLMSVQDQTNEKTVIYFTLKCPFEKGDTVFHAYHYETLNIDNKEYRVVAFKDILVKL